MGAMPAAAPIAPTGSLPALSMKLLPAAIVATSAIPLFGFENRLIGYPWLVIGLIVAFVVDRELMRDLGIIAAGLIVVSTVSVKADISWPNFFLLGFVLSLAVAVPFVLDRVVLKRRVIRFPWRSGQKWQPWEKSYLFAVPFLGWLILPFYFISSGAYLNWPKVDEASEVARLFVGVNAVGIWDELFFICTCYVLLLRHFPVLVANILQSIIFVSFLWELGYQAWGPLMTIPFAMLQGWIFHRTKSLTYVIIVHLLFDLVVFLAIVHAHNPGALPIFLIDAPGS
ncbi:CAAX prenyl protease-like protein [Microcella putealis]|uniref:CAAX prenyl protease-like protein n=2 Tax=Microcella putealis TaxID=337005 RepID=A0A4Q7LW65_9MICO|nr:CAAX prenyl protease-like protein [Microcella putealis]TQM24110.1 CAAX prenyl protease-like protein [Microcella putealis]